jgi:antitoxin StbD
LDYLNLNNGKSDQIALFQGKSGLKKFNFYNCWTFKTRSKNFSTKLSTGSHKMPSTILSETAASLLELKNDPLAIVAAGDGFPVAILDHDEPAFYCIPARTFETLMDKLEDMELAAIVESRKSQTEIDVAWDEL